MFWRDSYISFIWFLLMIGLAEFQFLQEMFAIIFFYYYFFSFYLIFIWFLPPLLKLTDWCISLSHSSPFTHVHPSYPMNSFHFSSITLSLTTTYSFHPIYSPNSSIHSPSPVHFYIMLAIAALSSTTPAPTQSNWDF